MKKNQCHLTHKKFKIVIKINTKKKQPYNYILTRQRSCMQASHCKPTLLDSASPRSLGQTSEIFDVFKRGERFIERKMTFSI